MQCTIGGLNTEDTDLAKMVKRTAMKENTKYIRVNLFT